MFGKVKIVIIRIIERFYKFSAHFDICAIEECFAGIVHRSPVAYYHTIKTPFAFQYLIVKILVMRSVLAVNFVVGTH